MSTHSYISLLYRLIKGHCVSGLLFSATMKKKIERLCRDILTDPIRIVIGEIGEVCSKLGIFFLLHMKLINDSSPFLVLFGCSSFS